MKQRPGKHQKRSIKPRVGFLNINKILARLRKKGQKLKLIKSEMKGHSN